MIVFIWTSTAEISRDGDKNVSQLSVFTRAMAGSHLFFFCFLLAAAALNDNLEGTLWQQRSGSSGSKLGNTSENGNLQSCISNSRYNVNVRFFSCARCDICGHVLVCTPSINLILQILFIRQIVQTHEYYRLNVERYINAGRFQIGNGTRYFLINFVTLT